MRSALTIFGFMLMSLTAYGNVNCTSNPSGLMTSVSLVPTGEKDTFKILTSQIQKTSTAISGGSLSSQSSNQSTSFPMICIFQLDPNAKFAGAVCGANFSKVKIKRNPSNGLFSIGHFIEIPGEAALAQPTVGDGDGYSCY